MLLPELDPEARTKQGGMKHGSVGKGASGCNDYASPSGALRRWLMGEERQLSNICVARLTWEMWEASPIVGASRQAAVWLGCRYSRLDSLGCSPYRRDEAGSEVLATARVASGTYL